VRWNGSTAENSETINCRKTPEGPGTTKKIPSFAKASIPD
jgi:hypothetical protein